MNNKNYFKAIEMGERKQDEKIKNSIRDIFKSFEKKLK